LQTALGVGRLLLLVSRKRDNALFVFAESTIPEKFRRFFIDSRQKNAKNAFSRQEFVGAKSDKLLKWKKTKERSEKHAIREKKHCPGRLEFQVASLR